MTTRIDVLGVIDQQKFGMTRAIIVISCLIVMFFDGYDFTLLGYVAPALMKQFQIDKVTFGFIISASVVGYMIGAFIFGDLGDRYGRRLVILAGVALFSILTFACIFSHSASQLTALRFCAGIGLGGSVPNAVSLNTENAPRRLAATVIGVLFVGFTLGGAAPGWTAAWLLSRYGWESVFIVGSVIPLVCLLPIALVLPESVKFLATQPQRHRELADLLNKLVPASRISADAQFFLSEEKRMGFPLRQLFSSGRAAKTVSLWVAFIFALGGTFFVASWTPTLLASVQIAPDRAALIGAMFLTGGALGSLLIPGLIDKIGPNAVIGSLVCTVPCVAVIGLVGSAELNLAIIVLCSGLLGAGSQAGLNAISGIIYPTVVRSTGVGWALGVGRIGAICAPILGGILIARGNPLWLMFVYAAGAYAVAAGALISMQLLSMRERRLRSNLA